MKFIIDMIVAGDQELPIVTHLVVEINQPAHNQEENSTDSD